MNPPYVPHPGSVPARVIAHMQEHDGQMSTGAIAELLQVPKANVYPCLAAAVKHGLLVRDKSTFTLGDGTPPAPTLRPVAAASVGTAHKAPAGAESLLDIVIYGDGDVAVKGHMVGEHDESTAVFSRAQIALLVQTVTRPLVEVAA